MRRRGLGFPVLEDYGNRVAEKFRLTWDFPSELEAAYLSFGLDLRRFNSDGGWSLPLPARYLVGQDGTIIAADINPDYTRRPEPEETLALARQRRKRDQP